MADFTVFLMAIFCAFMLGLGFHTSNQEKINAMDARIKKLEQSQIHPNLITTNFYRLNDDRKLVPSQPKGFLPPVPQPYFPPAPEPILDATNKYGFILLSR